MKNIFSLVIFFGIGWSTLHAEVDIKSLWKNQDTPRKHTITSLWKNAKPGKVHQDTTSRIQVSKSTLKKTSWQKNKTNKQLESIAKEINKVEFETIAINRVLDRLEAEQKRTEDKFQKAKKSMEEFARKIKKLDTKISGWHKALIDVMIDQFALVAAKKSLGQSTVNGVIQAEVYEAYKKKNAHELQALKTEIKKSKHAKEKLAREKNSIQKNITSIAAKRKLYRKKKKEQAQLLVTLAKKEEEYRSRLKAIMQRQDSLRQTLAHLNILHKKEIIAAKKAEEERRAELRRRTERLKRMRQAQAAQAKKAKAEGRAVTYSAPKITVAASTSAGSVKKYGSSYQASNIQAYRGAQTISPLAHARVVKRFGTYIDPIYKIKIFNDNIVLKATRQGAKVRNILNGKVVYLGQNNMLGKVVIVEHGNKLHTIYAALDRFSPLLHTGSRVKKGTIIGRVKRKLIFQATQNSKYINPLRLIRL